MFYNFSDVVNLAKLYVDILFEKHNSNFYLFPTSQSKLILILFLFAVAEILQKDYFQISRFQRIFIKSF